METEEGHIRELQLSNRLNEPSVFTSNWLNNSYTYRGLASEVNQKISGMNQVLLRVRKRYSFSKLLFSTEFGFVSKFR